MPLDSLDADVLFAVASRHLPSLCSLACTSKSLRDELHAALATCTSLRVQQEEVTPEVAEFLGRLALQHVWLVDHRTCTVEEIYIDWSALRTAAIIDFAALIRLPTIRAVLGTSCL